MNVLFYRYGSICEPDILTAFQKLGLTVSQCTAEITEKKLTVAQRLTAVSDALCKQPASLIFSVNFYPFLSDLSERLGLLYVCWSVDCPVLELFSVSIRNRCNRIFLFDYMQYETFHPENPEGIFYLPLSTNVARWDEIIENLTDKDWQQYSSDVSFVGSLYHEKSPLSPLHNVSLAPSLPAGNSTPSLSFSGQNDAQTPFLPVRNGTQAVRDNNHDSFSPGEYWQGYIKGITEAQLKLCGYNLLENTVTPKLITVLKDAFPDFYQPDNCFKDTDSYVAANYYLGMYVSELERIRVLNSLAEAGHRLTVYTRSNTSLLQGADCRGGVTTHTEMPKVFHCSKINLNITMKSIQSGLSLRVWDICGCGGFLLSNYQAEIPEYFEIGKDLDCYESVPDLKNKVSYYLTHDDLRREMAHNAYEKVKTLHTYEIRLATMLNTVFPKK